MSRILSGPLFFRVSFDKEEGTKVEICLSDKGAPFMLVRLLRSSWQGSTDQYTAWFSTEQVAEALFKYLATNQENP